MKVIQPLQSWYNPITYTNLSPDVLVSGTWNPGYTYGVGTKVLQINTYNNGLLTVYRSLIANNLNNDPTTPNSTAWIEERPANSVAMFDRKIDTYTSSEIGEIDGAEDKIIFSFENEEVFDTIAFLNITGVTVNVTMVYEGTTVFNQTKNINTSNIPSGSWSDFDTNYDTYSADNQIFTDIPPYKNPYPNSHKCIVTITITGDYDPAYHAGMNAACAMVVFGKSYEIGGTNRGVKLGFIDYSIKDTDEFGNITIVRRKYSKRMTANLEVETNDVDRVFNMLSTIRALLLVWVANDNFNTSLTIYGFYRDFEIDVAYPSVSYCSLTVEGL